MQKIPEQEAALIQQKAALVSCLWESKWQGHQCGTNTLEMQQQPLQHLPATFEVNLTQMWKLCLFARVFQCPYFMQFTYKSRNYIYMSHSYKVIQQLWWTCVFFSSFIFNCAAVRVRIHKMGFIQVLSNRANIMHLRWFFFYLIQ